MPIIMASPRTGKKPQIHESVYISPTAVIIGEVSIDEGSNIWFGVVLRGDFGTIKIGKNTSIQENVTIHMEVGSFVEIGDNCIIGHHAMIHGPCTIENGCVIGIASNVLHRTKVGEGSQIAAGAVLVNQELPPRSLAVGIPATVKKELPESRKLIGEKLSGMYVTNGKTYKEFFKSNPEVINF
ncbi:MAG: gamma carbonic anhydrase family protein [Candidatus Odinarchaeota archaeon]